MAQKIVAGNWKMNLLPDEGKVLIGELANFCEAQQLSKVKVVVAPPFTHLYTLAGEANGQLHISAQDCSAHASGAYTGEVSLDMIKACGANHTLIGHSERRQYHSESDELVNRKLLAALEAGITPILCVGEMLEDRRNNEYRKVIEGQIQAALKGIRSDKIAEVIVAYEPVWAIGTGETASPEQAQEVHGFIRAFIADLYSAEKADEVSILYGGSVKPENAREIFGQKDVDGGLIGGASLKYEQFVELISIGEEVL